MGVTGENSPAGRGVAHRGVVVLVLAACGKSVEIDETQASIKSRWLLKIKSPPFSVCNIYPP